MSKLKVLDLFSGIGGFSLGLERTNGFETVAFCEIEDFPRRVLAKHWPEVPCYHDVRELTAARLAADGIAVDVITGGFPCQPYSSAGKRQGARDDRSLWPEMFRLIVETRPAWVIAENVAGIISMELDQVFSDLESAGYAFGATDIPAIGVDAPHARHRWWIVGNANGASENTYTKTRSPNTRREAIGQPSWWPPEPRLGRISNGLSNRVDTHRLKALGNAVVPQIPELLGRAILRSLEETA